MSVLREELAKKNLTVPSSVKQAGTSFHQTVLMDQPWVSKDLLGNYSEYVLTTFIMKNNFILFFNKL